jgi:hypothetical protein
MGKPEQIQAELKAFQAQADAVAAKKARPGASALQKSPSSANAVSTASHPAINAKIAVADCTR